MEEMPIFSDYSTLIYDAVPLAVADDAAPFVIDCPSPFYGIYGGLKLDAGRGLNYHGELASNHMENIAVEKLALSIPPYDFNFISDEDFMVFARTYELYFIAAKAGYTGKHLCLQHSNHEETCSALDLMMNKLRDGNDLIQMHENFGTHDGQFQEGEGGPEDNGFVHDMSLDGVADDPMQIDAVEDYPNYATHSVQVYFNQNSMGLIDTTGIDSPDQLKGAAILIAHLPAGQYIFKYVRYGQEIRMDNDDFHHFLEDLTDIHIWDGELVTVS